jgi:3-oxoacyl-[acyl-carrier protein] reductase
MSQNSPSPKTAIVTGGSRGIGRAVALKFASLGINVAVVYAGNTEKAEAVCAEAAALGVTALPYQCDVADFAAVKSTVAAIKKAFPSVDILVNCAGITRDGLLAMMKEDQFDAVVDTNLKGTFNFIRQCTPIFMKARKGKIINISSVAGIMGNAGQANYAASKAGVIGLTKSVARELASRNVCCNAIAPGMIETDMTADFSDADPIVQNIPLGRKGQPEEIAALAAFLASDEANYITGEVIRVDGGLAI